MKKLLLLLLLGVFSIFTAKAQCDWILEMNDTYGDGWDDHSVEVYVNGELSFTGTYTTSDSGAACLYDSWSGGNCYSKQVPFAVFPDDIITTVWVTGSACCVGETSYKIIDSAGTVIHDVSASDTAPTTATCPAPPSAPDNDLCSGSIDLGTLTSPISATLVSATDSYAGNGSYGCYIDGSPEIFYNISVPYGYELTIGQTENDFDSKQIITYGETCPGDTPITCQDDPDTADMTWTNDTGSSQTVHYIQSSFNGASGTFTLAWSLDQVPAPECVTITSPEDLATDVVLADGGLILSWAASSTGATPTSYEVYFGTDSSALTLATTTTATSYTASSLEYDTNYFWKVVPYNLNSYPTDCSTSSFTTQSEPTCFVVNQLSASVVSTQATITFNDTNETDVNDYEYELLDITAGETADESIDGTVLTQQIDLENLTIGNNYQILVRTACNRGGLNEEFSNWSVALDWLQVEPVDCVTNLSPATDDIVNGGIVTLTWDLATTGGTPTGHKILWSAVDEASMTSLGTAGATSTSVEISNVGAAGTYYYSIVPTNDAGDATGCSVQTFTTYPEDVGGSSCENAVAVTEGTYSTSIPTADDAAWFVYTAATSGSLNVSSCGGGKDTTLDIYEVCGGSTYASGGDTCSMSPSGGGSSYAAEATFDVTAGQSYYIAWDDAYNSALWQWSITLTSPCSGPITTWDGTAWSNGAPDANSYAIMSGAYSTDTDGAITACYMQADANVTIGGTTDAAISEVLVMAGNTLTIDETSSLTISGDFTNTGTVTLNSTADDFSSLVVEGTATGDITYNRYVNVYNTDGGWDFVGSPTAMTIEDFTTANGGDLQILEDDFALASYNNATGQWELYPTESPTGSFTAGQGYAMATAAGSTVAFTGAMQTTDQTINVVNNDALNGVGRRWNLVSNPFPSYMAGNPDAATAAGTAANFLIANATVINNEFLYVYGWDGSDYAIYNNLSGAFSMAPGQGFWVAAASTSATALNFTADMRTTTGTGDFVSGPQLLTHHVAVKLFNGETERATTDFYFRDGLSLGLDPGYDAGAFNQSMALSSRLAQGKPRNSFCYECNGYGCYAEHESAFRD